MCDLQEALDGYVFTNKSLLEEAFTHPSLCREAEKKVVIRMQSYERLEFLGDAVLDLVISVFLLKHYPQESEGDLAKRRAALVCGETLAMIASSLNLGNYLVMTEGEESTGGKKSASNLANVLEALVGALYLDGGLQVAEQFVHKHWLPFAHTMLAPPSDPKTRLQEWAQSRKKPIPDYKVVASTGPSHAPSFTVRVSVEGMPPVEANGSSKRLAEREAASLLLDAITKIPG